MAHAAAHRCRPTCVEVRWSRHERMARCTSRALPGEVGEDVGVREVRERAGRLLLCREDVRVAVARVALQETEEGGEEGVGAARQGASSRSNSSSASSEAAGT